MARQIWPQQLLYGQQKKQTSCPYYGPSQKVQLSSVLFHLCLPSFQSLKFPAYAWEVRIAIGNYQINSDKSYTLYSCLTHQNWRGEGRAPPHSWLSHCGASLLHAIMQPTLVINQKSTAFAFFDSKYKSTGEPVIINLGSKRVCGKKCSWSLLAECWSASWQVWDQPNHKSCIRYKSITADTPASPCHLS